MTEQAKDPVFFLYAVSTFSAALLPQVPLASQEDIAKAEEVAIACARLLDSGTVPDGFVLHHHEIDIARAERLNEPSKRRMTAYEVQKLQEEALAASKAGRTPPNVEQAKAANAKEVAALADLSAPVRHAALAASIARIGALKGVTGAQQTNALNIVAIEIGRARRLAASFGVTNDTIEQTYAKAQEKGEAPVFDMILPYPTNILAAIVGGMIASLAGDEPEEPKAGEAAAGT